MTAPPPVLEHERRLRWPGWPTLLFLGLLALLLALVGMTLVMRPARPGGLPGDAVLLGATGLPDASLGVLTAGLRFRSATFGGAPSTTPNDAAALARVRQAEHALERWIRLHPGEPRARATLGALALVRHDYATATNRYREACERAPHYGEGRLGWGMALALDAARTSEPWQRRALMLRAIAQFAAVDATEPEYLPALHNRTQLLFEVGRIDEALTLARRYLALEPTGPWSDRLRAEMRER